MFTIDATDRYHAPLSLEISPASTNSQSQHQFILYKASHQHFTFIPPSCVLVINSYSHLFFYFSFSPLQLLPLLPLYITLLGPPATNSLCCGCKEETALVHCGARDLLLNYLTAQLSLLPTRDFPRHAYAHRFAIWVSHYGPRLLSSGWWERNDFTRCRG